MKAPFSGRCVSHQMNNTNLFVVTSVHEFSGEWQQGLEETAIRYVISGEEIYRVNKESVRVKGGNFLHVNKGQPHEVDIPYTKERTAGFCLTISNKVLNDVYHNKVSDTGSLLDNPFGKQGTTFDFVEGIYHQDDILNEYLASLKNKVDPFTGAVAVTTAELFFTIAGRLLASQSVVAKKINQVHADKYSTRRELYKRIDKAKMILEEDNTCDISMAKLANSVALSEFHFYRTFKQIHNITPYQYRLKKRMQRARQKLLDSNTCISQLAYDSGFADVQTFSKAFKKEFSLAPGRFRKHALH